MKPRRKRAHPSLSQHNIKWRTDSVRDYLRCSRFTGFLDEKLWYYFLQKQVMFTVAIIPLFIWLNSHCRRQGNFYLRNVSYDGPFLRCRLNEEILPACEQLRITTLQFDNASRHVVENDGASIAVVITYHSTFRVLKKTSTKPWCHSLGPVTFSCNCRSCRTS